MRLFEILLVVFLGLFVLAGPLPASTNEAFRGRFGVNLRPLLALAPLAVLVIHLIAEGWRWQMVPLYALAAGILTWALVQALTGSIPEPIGVWRSAGLLALLALLAALPALIPVPRFPTPTGPYAVGTLSFPLVDGSRTDIYGDQADEPRSLMVQVWYPANPTPEARFLPWLQDGQVMQAALAKVGGMPSFFPQHLGYARSNSLPNVPPREDLAPFPVLHFIHGWSGNRALSTYLVEDLASRGYVVVSADHPYAAMASVFPDGRVASFKREILPTGAPEAVYDAAARQLVAQWVEDIAFVQDTLEALSVETAPSQLAPLVGRLALPQIGLFGHSTGGAAAVQFCAQDPRCQAAVGLDPWMVPLAEAVLTSGAPQPMLFLFSDPALAYFEPKNRVFFERFASHLGDHFLDLFIAGTGHHDFDDTGTLSPIARLLGHSKGPLPIERAFAIQRVYVADFFDHFLLGGPRSPLLAGPSPDFPEVRWPQGP